MLRSPAPLPVCPLLPSTGCGSGFSWLTGLLLAVRLSGGAGLVARTGVTRALASLPLSLAEGRLQGVFSIRF